MFLTIHAFNFSISSPLVAASRSAAQRACSATSTRASASPRSKATSAFSNRASLTAPAVAMVSAVTLATSAPSLRLSRSFCAFSFSGSYQFKFQFLDIMIELIRTLFYFECLGLPGTRLDWILSCSTVKF